MVYTKEIELLQNFALPNEVEMKKCVHKQDKIKNWGKFFLKTHEQIEKKLQMTKTEEKAKNLLYPNTIQAGYPALWYPTSPIRYPAEKRISGHLVPG